MNRLLAFLLLLLMCCGTAPARAQTVTDTARLLNPRHLPGAYVKDLPQGAMAMWQPGYYLMLKGRMHPIATLPALRAFLHVHHREIASAPFYLLMVRDSQVRHRAGGEFKYITTDANGKRDTSSVPPPDFFRSLYLDTYGEAAAAQMIAQGVFGQESYSVSKAVAVATAFREEGLDHYRAIDIIPTLDFLEGDPVTAPQPRPTADPAHTAVPLDRKEDPVVVMQPEGVADSTPADTNAANFWIIRVTPKTVTARLGGRLSQLKTTAALRSFLAKNRALLQSGRIVLSVSGDTPVKKMEPVFKALGDQGLNRFNLVVPLEEGR